MVLRTNHLPTVHKGRAGWALLFRDGNSSGSNHLRLTPHIAWAKLRANSPLPELLEDHSVGKALAADADALQDAIAAQLVQHQVWVQFASLQRKTCRWSHCCSKGLTRKVQVDAAAGDQLCPAPLPSILTFFSWLGMMQRTKLGLVFLSVAMSLASCSLYSCPTVRNMPFRVLKAPGSAVSDMPATWSKPMIRSTVRNIKLVSASATLKPHGAQERQTPRQGGGSVWSCRTLLLRTEKLTVSG